MRRFWAYLLLTLACATGAGAQEDDPGFLERLLQDSLSDAGREVRVRGFEGALSSRATLEELTIADDQGIWLTLRRAELDWNRSALLRGRLEINALAAEELLLPRGPVPASGPSVPAPGASGFHLPELPVSIDIGRLAIDRAEIGAPLLGEDMVLRLEGRARLDEGVGDTLLTVARIDGRQGDVRLDAAFANATETLRLDLSLTEEANGIAANLIGLPGKPSVEMSVKGDGTLSDFAADIRLATDGAERLAGQLTLAAEPGEAGTLHRFAADIGGDLAPVFSPEYRPFFGPDIRMQTTGTRAADGRVELSELILRTDSLQLDGRLALAADGLPESFNFTGAIRDESGAPVLLPVGETPTRIGSAELLLRFDAAQGDLWAGGIGIDALDRPEATVERLELTGSGTISRANGNAVTANLRFAGQGVALADPGAAEALGQDIDGTARIAWEQGAPIIVDALRLTGGDYAFNASGEIAASDRDIAVSGKMALSVPDLSPFSTLAGRPLAGGLAADLSGSGQLLGGQFDIDLAGQATDLALGIAEFDALAGGTSVVRLIAKRDLEGTEVRTARIDGTHLQASGSAVLRRAGSFLALEARLPETALVLQGLSGAARVDLTAGQQDAGWQVEATVTAPGDAQFDLAGVVTDPLGDPGFEGGLSLGVGSLTPYAQLSGQRLSGGLSAEALGRVTLSDRSFALRLDAEGRDLAIGQAEVDRLLRGQSQLELTAEGQGDTVQIDTLSAETPQLSAGAEGRVGPDTALSLTARLADLGLFAPGISGPLTVEGRAGRQAGGDWQVRLDANGPAGSGAGITGSLTPDFARAALDISGSAPLGLAGPFIAPNSVDGRLDFDLRLDGVPGLPALTGTLTTAGARVVVPAPPVVLDDAGARIALRGGRADVSARAAVRGGGQVSVDGPVALSAPFSANLVARLLNVAVSDPELYATTLNGEVAVSGPLTGGAALTGGITLGPTELRVPSTGLSGLADIPEITHVNEPAAVRATRARAGLLGGGSGPSSGRPYPLDLTVSAPNRIFIRGRGLDAELGGSLRITGTTANVVPSGQFDLIRGRLDILARRLTLDEGFARLEGAFVPFIRLVSTTQVEDTRISVEVEGPADEPEVRLVSVPDLPEDEILARLLFDRGIENISPLQAAELAGAVATLAGRGGGGVVGRLRRNFGLDDLDVTTDDEGNTAVRAGRYLSENVYTDVTVGQGESEINLNLDLSPNITAKGHVSSSGESGLGIFFERDY